jgi:hypothetical protein
MLQGLLLLACGSSMSVLALSKRAREACFALWWGPLRGAQLIAQLTSRAKLKTLSAAAPLSGRVLEVGSGDGLQLEYLCGPAAPLVREVVCVEPNASFYPRLTAAIKAAEERAGLAQIKLKVCCVSARRWTNKAARVRSFYPTARVTAACAFHLAPSPTGHPLPRHSVRSARILGLGSRRCTHL